MLVTKWNRLFKTIGNHNVGFRKQSKTSKTGYSKRIDRTFGKINLAFIEEKRIQSISARVYFRMCKARNRVRKCNERRTNIFIGVSTTLGAVASVLHLRNPHSIICDVTHRRLCATTIFIQRLFNVGDVYLFSS